MTSALLENYGVRDLALARGRGSHVWCEAGRKYLDFAMGIAVNSLGHCHPQLVAALTAQADTLWHTSNLFRIPAGEALAEKLTGLCFADRVFFCNSGAEAIECGFKMMRRYHHARGESGRKRIVSLSDAFHGRTLATIAAAGNAAHCEGFLAGDGGFDQAEFGDIASLRAVVGPTTAGIVIEPVQGEGGIRPADPDYLRAVRALCDEHGILLMFDEVQCGLGRCGSFYAHQRLGVEPDLLASAKGLGGGFPVGACLAREAVAAAMTAGTHGSTFGGNPLAMAVAGAVVDEIAAPGFLDAVRGNGEHLLASLRELAGKYPAAISNVAGLGLMIGVFLRPDFDAGEFIRRLRGEGLLVVKGGNNSIRLLPPLNVRRSEIDQALALIESALAALRPQTSAA
ncbi:MAG: aspartate aminotransferase family protein, partial [Gammaproteobacteria bacterium]|nr:aspartate aminotransferase family protein [Gammaproteobacteria bacterium]